MSLLEAIIVFVLVVGGFCYLFLRIERLERCVAHPNSVRWEEKCDQIRPQ
jgi:hypothetical protein